VKANDDLAQSILRTLATASETYYQVHEEYPATCSELIYASPPFLNEDYCDLEKNGYCYSCNFSREGYLFIATPLEKETTGSAVYTIKTGGFLD